MKQMNKKKTLSNEKMTRRERNEHLTNWYIINLCWGVVGFLVLLGIRQGYRSTASILYMQPLMWVLTALFAVFAIVLFVLAKTGKVKNALRAKHYGWFMAVCAMVGLWFALYNKIRLVMESCAQALLSRPELTVSSYWNVRIPMIGIAVYLIIGLIYFAVKVTRK